MVAAGGKNQRVPDLAKGGESFRHGTFLWMPNILHRPHNIEHRTSNIEH